MRKREQKPSPHVASIVIKGIRIIYENEIFICNNPPQTTKYCPLLAPPNQTSKKVTHPGIALVSQEIKT
jgi:hypothetical protein